MGTIQVVSYREMNKYRNFPIINTTSRSKDWSRQLSPFFLGPVDLYGGYTAKNVENAWQYSKVYPEFVDEHSLLMPNKYYRWATNGWNDDYAVRYPMGKGTKPLYSWWDGKVLNYVEARKQIYAPLYAQAVLKTGAWGLLQSVYTDHGGVTLLDFDGYDYLEMGISLTDVLNDHTRKMGHAFVLAMLLQYPQLQIKYGGK